MFLSWQICSHFFLSQEKAGKCGAFFDSLGFSIDSLETDAYHRSGTSWINVEGDCEEEYAKDEEADLHVYGDSFTLLSSVEKFVFKNGSI